MIERWDLFVAIGALHEGGCVDFTCHATMIVFENFDLFLKTCIHGIIGKMKVYFYFGTRFMRKFNSDELFFYELYLTSRNFRNLVLIPDDRSLSLLNSVVTLCS